MIFVCILSVVGGPFFAAEQIRGEPALEIIKNGEIKFYSANNVFFYTWVKHRDKLYQCFLPSEKGAYVTDLFCHDTLNRRDPEECQKSKTIEAYYKCLGWEDGVMPRADDQ